MPSLLGFRPGSVADVGVSRSPSPEKFRLPFGYSMLRVILDYSCHLRERDEVSNMGPVPLAMRMHGLVGVEMSLRPFGVQEWQHVRKAMRPSRGDASPRV
jgi:hypothetical protein